MKQWVKKLTSAFLASLLTVSLNGRACAEPEGDPVPETPPQISEPPLSDDLPAATADDAVTAADDELPAATDELPKADALPAAAEELPKADALPAAAEELPKVDALPAAADELPKADALPAAVEELPKADAAPAATDELPKADALPAAAEELPKADALPAAADELPKADALTAVTAGPDAAPRNTTSGAKNSDGSITQLEDGSFVLINHTGAESLEADGDITILVAGLNRVASISGAGKVNIAGTGILLVDSLEGDLDLLTLTDVYDKGSAAVFVKQTDGTYLLVNGAVPGLLDEEYTIDDASLVMPDHSSLLLCGTGAEAIRDDDGNVTEVQYYHGTEHNYHADDSGNVIEQVGKLTITGAASLTLRNGAALVLENLRSLGCTDTFDHTRYPELVLKDGGTLTVEGEVTGGGFVTVDGNGSSMAGSGTVTASRIIVGDPNALSDSDLTFSDGAVYLNGEGTYQDLKIDSSVIHMENTSAAVSGLQTSGDTTLLLYGGNDVGLGSVEGTLSLRTLMGPSCTVRGDIGGDGTLRFDRGSFILAEGIKLNGVSISMEAGGRVFDHAGVLEPSLPLMHVSPADMTRADQSQDHSIPVTAAWMFEHAERNKLSYTDVIRLGENTSIIVPQGEGGNLVLSTSDLQTLIGAYKAALNWKENEGFIQIQLLRLNNGTFSLDTFYEGELAQEAAGDVCLVRILFLQATSYVDPIGASTQTGTLFTGSGILGGSGAGSVHYGSTNPGDPNGSGDNTGGDNGDSGDPNGGGDNTGGDNGDSGNPNGGGDDNGGDNGGSGDPSGSGGNNGQTETESDTETVSAHQTATVWVEPQNDGASYLLCAAQGEKTLQTLGGSVSVSMHYELSSRDAGKALYAVFRNADGSFTAVRARYSRMKGELYFETDRLGAFVVVAFDYDGEEFSDAFYAELETLPELRLLS